MIKPLATKGGWRTAGTGRFLEMLLVVCALTALWRYGYFLAAPWIWERNIPFSPEQITPWVRPFTKEHDGVEIYALYVLVFLNLAGALALTPFLEKLSAPYSRAIALGAAALLCALFCAAVGLTLPMGTLAETPLGTALSQTVLAALAAAPGVALLWYAQRRSQRLALAAAALLLAPPCFLATSTYGWHDYIYIFAPARRLLDGALPSEIYFQYDLLPSLLAAAWMKLGLDLNGFRVLGQAGYYLALLGVFILSSRLFRRKELSVFLLAALVLVRIYASPFDATLSFQVTPWRLDLWLPFLLVVYRFGPYHWLAGITGGLLMLLAKNFGIIYALAYLQLLVALWLIAWLDAERKALGESLVRHGRRALFPVAIMAMSGAASHFIFHNSVYGDFAGYYRKIGIGFIQIAGDSFYWYIVPLFSLVPVLLLRLRKSLSQQYLDSGLFLTFLAIGNSIYFFGRSHPNNILNISIVLLFLFFLALDLAGIFLGGTEEGRGGVSPLHKRWPAAVSIPLLAAAMLFYSDNLAKKGITQITNVANARIAYHSLRLPDSFPGYMAKIREVTENSSKLFFVDESDFTFYYFGGYAQSGYCNPLPTWIFTKDLQAYLQKRLDDGYYLVCSPTMAYLLKGLSYDYRTLVGDTIVVAKSSQGARGQ